MQLSQEYIAALTIVIVGLLKAFGVEIGSSEVTAGITTLLALWVMIRRYSKGDIKVSGVKK